ncbi:MAG: PQQ-binding-like beta-propeller repeat protein [Acidobacteria bacterium]|nr:PQQ-binding-like beta-propeller repeat protein [Acidobacteriota bacterium]
MFKLKKNFIPLFLFSFLIILPPNKPDLLLSKVWEVSFPSNGKPRAIVAAPIGNNERIYGVAKNGIVQAISLQGKVVWEYDAGEEITLPLLILRGLLFVLSPSGRLIALNVETGEVFFEKNFGKGITSGAVSQDGTILLGFKGGKLCAFSCLSGKKLWSFSTQGDIVASPLIIREKLFLGTTKGKLYSIDPKKKGRPIWEKTLPGELRASIVYSKGKLFLGSTSDYFYAVDATSGKMKWRFRTGGDIITKAIAWKNYIIVSSLDSSLYCFSQKRGHLIYRIDLPFRSYLSPLSAFDHLFIAPYGSKLLIIEPRTGRRKGELEVGELITSPPLYFHNLIIVGTNKGKLVGFGKGAKANPPQEDNSRQQQQRLWRRLPHW